MKKLSLLLMALSEGKKQNPVLQVINAYFVISPGLKGSSAKPQGNVIVRQCRREGDKEEVCVPEYIGSEFPAPDHF